MFELLFILDATGNTVSIACCAIALYATVARGATLAWRSVLALFAGFPTTSNS